MDNTTNDIGDTKLIRVDNEAHTHLNQAKEQLLKEMNLRRLSLSETIRLLSVKYLDKEL